MIKREDSDDAYSNGLAFRSTVVGCNAGFAMGAAPGVYRFTVIIAWQLLVYTLLNKRVKIKLYFFHLVKMVSKKKKKRDS